MLNELYTFAEPVQVVPFSNLKWGKFTLLHTDNRGYVLVCHILQPQQDDSSVEGAKSVDALVQQFDLLGVAVRVVVKVYIQFERQ